MQQHHRREQDQQRTGRHGPGQERGSAGQGIEHQRAPRRARVPHEDRPPHRHGEQLREDLRHERLLGERADEIRARKKQQHDGRQRERDARDVAIHGVEQPQRDEQHESSLERDRPGHDRIERVERVAPKPRARQHGEQMHAGRVVDHLAEILAEPHVVHETLVALDVLDEREMMREVRTAASRQQVRPRKPQQPREHAADKGAERNERGGGRGRASPETEKRSGRCDRRRQQDRERHDPEAEPVRQICGDDGRGEKSESGRGNSLRADERHGNRAYHPPTGARCEVRLQPSEMEREGFSRARRSARRGGASVRQSAEGS